MSTQLMSIRVAGVPRPQGSMRIVTSKSTGRAFARYSATTVEHRNLMIGSFAELWGGAEPYRGPVAVSALFELKRPAGHYRTGKHAGELRPSAPARWHTNVPDVDKLIRLVNDALALAGVIVDDRLVAIGREEKIWSTNDATTITVMAL